MITLCIKIATYTDGDVERYRVTVMHLDDGLVTNWRVDTLEQALAVVNQSLRGAQKDLRL